MRRNIPRVRQPIVLLLGAGVGVALLLIAFAHGYGYHRDELYFLAAGNHLAWGFPDQGPLSPLIAHLMGSLAPQSLTVLRIPSALAAGGVVVLTGLISREFGGAPRAQLLAAGCAAASPVVLSIGHLLSTSTFDLLAWTLVTWLIARAQRTQGTRLWIAAGLVAGIALLNKPLIAAFAVAAGIAVGLVGPRELLRRRAVWMAAGIAVLLWLPWLLWQSDHSWPQLHLASSVSSGGSATSQPRWALVPFQFLLAGPPLVLIWLAGLRGLLVGPRLRPYRWLGVAWLILVVVFELAGGKPYYLAGLLPMLFAAGSLSVDNWLERGSQRLRRDIVIAAVALSGIASALIGLPLLPADDAGLAVAMNADVGETIGWPELTRQVADLVAQAPKPVVILTENYGEAGAVDHFGGPLGLPQAYSGHNAFGLWGPPPDGERSVVAVGLHRLTLESDFRGCGRPQLIRNAAGIDNEENGKLIVLCGPPRLPWLALWPTLRHLS